MNKILKLLATISSVAAITAGGKAAEAKFLAPADLGNTTSGLMAQTAITAPADQFASSFTQALAGISPARATTAQLSAAFNAAMGSIPGQMNAANMGSMLNALGLSGDALAQVVAIAASQMDTGVDAVASSMLVDSFMSGGRSEAQQTAAALTDALGEDLMQNVLLAREEDGSIDLVDTTGGTGPYAG